MKEYYFGKEYLVGGQQEAEKDDREENRMLAQKKVSENARTEADETSHTEDEMDAESSSSLRKASACHEDKLPSNDKSSSLKPGPKFVQG